MKRGPIWFIIAVIVITGIIVISQNAEKERTRARYEALSVTIDQDVVNDALRGMEQAKEADAVRQQIEAQVEAEIDELRELQKEVLGF